MSAIKRVASGAELPTNKWNSDEQRAVHQKLTIGSSEAHHWFIRSSAPDVINVIISD
jgi:hypothetical protein